MRANGRRKRGVGRGVGGLLLDQPIKGNSVMNKRKKKRKKEVGEGGEGEKTERKGHEWQLI